MEDSTIRITHYINPHMFWYKPVSAYVHNLEEKRFQLAIDEYCEENFREASADRNYEAFPGETVAVLDFDRNKWCRCVVDEVIEGKDGDKRYSLWAIDDGVPIQSSSQYVNLLPQKFSSDVSSKVKRGAIKNVLPSECIFDNHMDKLISKITLRWDNNASGVLQSIIQNASTIYFRNVTKHHVHNVLVNFGDLEIVSRKDNFFNAGQILKEIRQATEVEPRDFITRLSEIQTMSVNRCLTNDATEKRSHGKVHSASPIKTQYERNGSNKIPNGAGDDGQSRDLELNGVDEEDFDESASMIRPNHTRECTRPQPSVEAIAENSHSDDETYPIASSRVKNARNIQYEKQLWQQKTRPYNPITIANLRINQPSDHKSNNLSFINSPLEKRTCGEIEPEELSGKPKSTVSFLAKLEMRKKQRAAQKSIDEGEQTQKTSSPSSSHRYTNINIIPAGFNMGNIGFDSGRVVAGDSSDSSERKSKHTSPSFKLRQSKMKQEKSQHSLSDEQQQQRHVDADLNGGKFSNGHDSGVENGRVFVTKNTSRFDQLIEEEACIRSRLCHQRLLVHGKRIPKPIERLENANFCPEVHRELNMFNFNSIHRIQTYAWPHILRGNSFFCVNSAMTGKTFAFLPAICSSVMKMHDEELVPKGAGPMAIIICKSSREVQRVASYCKKMLNFSINKAMAVVEAFGARDITKACNLLLNGCAILVATAPGYRRVFESMPNAFVKERIQSIVIDNIDSIIERFGSELQLLCKNCDKPEIQMVVTATYWNPLFFGFLKKYKNMIICIGAYLEAAIYGKSNLVLKLQTRDKKISEIIHFVKTHDYQNERTLIVCSNASEVYEVTEQLKNQSITHMFCNDQTMLSKMDGFKEWDNQLPGEMHVMVCYDAVLPDMEINKAQHIIHFSLPKSWTMFTRRFACSFGYYRNPLCDDTTMRYNPSSSLVLLDENNNEQLPKLVEFLRIHNQEVAESIVKLTNNIRIQQEEEKLSLGNPVDFCHQVLDFGTCRSAGCMKRHVFTTRDLSLGTLPSSGVIKLKIYNMFSPTHYTARVLEHRDYGANSWTTVNDAQEFFALDIEIQQHYANEERHCSHGDVHYNDWCVIYDELRYWRCRIMSIEPKKEHVTSRKLKVKLLDIGRTVDCVSSELLYMPKEFCRLPAQAIDIRIVGVVPHDFETEWDKRVTVTIREWIDKYTANDKFHVEGKIMLAIRDVIWVDTIRLVEHLRGINTDINEIHVKSQIIGKNFGVTDKEPLVLLNKMVQDCEAYRKRANNLVGEEAVDDKNVADNCGTDLNTNQFFPNDTRLKDIDKCVQSPVLLKPIENSDTDSDDCASVVAKTKDSETTNSVDISNDLPKQMDELQITPSRERRDRNFFETYDDFEMEETYEVFISQYYGPDDFYICRVERFSLISTMIANFAEAETTLVPLQQAQVGDYCLVLYDNAYQRAKIIHIQSRDIRVFFLDLGGYDMYSAIDLFELPDDLLKASSFCAIKGKFACLQPREEESQTWSSEIGDKIYDQVLANYRTFNAKALHVIEQPHADPLVKCNSYRFLLFDPEHELESWIFDEIVELKLARYIEDERPYAIDINFGDDDFRQFLDPSYKVPKKSNDNNFEIRIEEITEPTQSIPPNEDKPPPEKASTKLTLLKQRLRKKKLETSTTYPRLKRDFCSPKTIWRQDNSFIVIRIASPENVVYDMAVDSDSLEVCYVHDEEKYLLSIVFFGAIMPELTIHEVRGLSIVVRLVKLVPTMQWPSVMRHGDKVPWLQQCIEVPNSDETDATDGMQQTFPSVPNLNDVSDSSSEEPDFGDQFDQFDPIEDDYFMRDE
ncbi:putative ATP-dependent RNA helicase SoYb [Topomyia yanbarensis]|uniref:putative ATP-dependent RNA helicase SoYb n=1 Tax=Topomyia yanbarensis TaxID=2498891 RepID=UPI00273B4AD9|nr:putative ATP-dependent RNA helicase SoYb [Topomyia yanbarensis]XP_058826647.1 putative ATP-dependent RNA helicase SoYb [Topomyia yanbarensis]